MAEETQPQNAPSLNLPKGSEMCELFIINMARDLTVPLLTLIEPSYTDMNGSTFQHILSIPGMPNLESRYYSTSDRGRIGTTIHPSVVVAVLDSNILGNRVQKEIIQILPKVSLTFIEALAFRPLWQRCNTAQTNSTCSLVTGSSRNLCQATPPRSRLRRQNSHQDRML